MITILMRTVIIYFVVLFAIRIMGKSGLSSMDPFQILILFFIGELAAMPVESSDTSLIDGIAAILTIVALEEIVAFAAIKSETLRVFFSGKPNVLINDGAVNEAELLKLKISLSDLNEALRLKDIPSISDVAFAVLETNGDISVILKPEKQPVTVDDLKISKSKLQLPCVLISDGNIYSENLKLWGKTKTDLTNTLLSYGVDNYKDVFLCVSDTDSKLHIQLKEKDVHKKKFMLKKSDMR